MYFYCHRRPVKSFNTRHSIRQSFLFFGHFFFDSYLLVSRGFISFGQSSSGEEMTPRYLWRYDKLCACNAATCQQMALLTGARHLLWVCYLSTDGDRDNIEFLVHFQLKPQTIKCLLAIFIVSSINSGQPRNKHTPTAKTAPSYETNPQFMRYIFHCLQPNLLNQCDHVISRKNSSNFNSTLLN